MRRSLVQTIRPCERGWKIENFKQFLYYKTNFSVIFTNITGSSVLKRVIIEFKI